MATTTVLSNPALEINSVDFTDQCTSATVTYQFDELEATTFGDTSRKYTEGPRQPRDHLHPHAVVRRR
jgi:hypothetical protein